MLKTKLLFIVALMALFSGCTSLLQVDEYDGKPYAIAPPDGKAMVVFYRYDARSPVNYNGPAAVFVDGVKVASFSVKEKTYAFIEPGEHKFFLYGVAGPTLYDGAIIEGNLKANKIYYLGAKYRRKGMFEGYGWAVEVAVNGLQDKEKGDDLLAWLLQDKLVLLNKEKAKKASLENADAIKEVLADAEKKWAETPENKRLYLRESKRINEVDWRIDGKKVQPSLPYGNL
jgi:hypothetical protein